MAQGFRQPGAVRSSRRGARAHGRGAVAGTSVRLVQAGLLGVLALMGSATWASPSVLKLANFDTTFSGLCASGTVQASGNKCEQAAIELKRGQDNGTGGNAEIHARTGVFGDVLSGDVTLNGSTTSNTVLQSNGLPWGKNSTDTYTMSWRLDGNPDADSAFRLSVSVDGATTTNLVLDAADASFASKNKPNTDGSAQLWIRLRTLDAATPGSVSLTSIFSQGTTFALNASTWTIASGAGDANPYFLVQGLDFSQPWYVEGSASLSFAGSTSKERPAINWKFTESMGGYGGQTLANAAPVPEPASLLLYSAALGVLGLARRRVRQG